MVVIGVVARDLAPSRDREETDLVELAVKFGKPLDRGDIARGLPRDIPVEVGVSGQRPVFQTGDQL